MKSLFTTWTIFALTLATAAQPVFAGGRIRSSRSTGGNFSRPALKAPAFGSGPKAVRSAVQFPQPNSRAPAIVSGNQGKKSNNVQVPKATRDMVGGGSIGPALPGKSGGTPAAGSFLRTNPDAKGGSKVDGSKLADIRERLAGGTSPRVGDLTPDAASQLKDGQPIGRHELGLRHSVGKDLDVRAPGIRADRRPEPSDSSSAGDNSTDPNPGPRVEDPPLGTGTVVGEELQPVKEEPPKPTEDDHQIIPPLPGEHPGERFPIPPKHPDDGYEGQPPTDWGSIVDAISGLVGSIGSTGGSCASCPSGGGDAGAATPVESAPVQAVPIETAPVQVTDAVTVDIQLVDVRLVDTGNLERSMGPRFRLTYKNVGTVEVSKFHATVAVDATDKLTDMAEIVTVEAVGLKPGKTQSVDVRLPVEVLKMATDKNGKPAPFATLVALIDSDDDLVESDEENNVQILARNEIQPVSKGGTIEQK